MHIIGNELFNQAMLASRIIHSIGYKNIYYTDSTEKILRAADYYAEEVIEPEKIM